MISMVLRAEQLNLWRVLNVIEYFQGLYAFICSYTYIFRAKYVSQFKYKYVQQHYYDFLKSFFVRSHQVH
jgi:hypothetical protein